MNGFQQMMHQPLSLIRYGFFMLLLVASALAQANVAGHVIMVRGDVIARSADGVERKLERRSEVLVADTLVTGAGSRVQIRFIDNAMLALSEHTQLSIEAYQQASQNGTQDKVVMNLLEGGFRTLTGSIGKGNPDAYRVDTPAASIGIRGTLYSAHYRNNQLSAGVWQGGIRLFTPQGNFNLGQDAAFNFARVTPQGFQGLLNQPQELDNAPNNDNTDNQDNGQSNSQDDNNDAGVQNQEQASMNAPQSAFNNDAEPQPNPLTAQINPLENNGSDNAAGILQDEQGNPVTNAPQNSPLSTTELERLNQTNIYAFVPHESGDLLRIILGDDNKTIAVQDEFNFVRSTSNAEIWSGLKPQNDRYTPKYISETYLEPLGISWVSYSTVNSTTGSTNGFNTDSDNNQSWIEFELARTIPETGSLDFNIVAYGSENDIFIEGALINIDLSNSNVSGIFYIYYDNSNPWELSLNGRLNQATLSGDISSSATQNNVGRFNGVISQDANQPTDVFGLIVDFTAVENNDSIKGTIIMEGLLTP